MLNRVDDQLNDARPHLIEWFGDGEAGRVLVAAAAELSRDGAHVDVVLRSHADADVAAGPELEKDDRLNLPRGERQIDQAFGVVVSASAGGKHRLVHVED